MQASGHFFPLIHVCFVWLLQFFVCVGGNVVRSFFSLPYMLLELPFSVQNLQVLISCSKFSETNLCRQGVYWYSFTKSRFVWIFNNLLTEG